jgi:hypothetical protein
VLVVVGYTEIRVVERTTGPTTYNVTISNFPAVLFL